MKKMLMTAMKTSISEVMETMFFLPVEFGPQSPLAQIGMEKDTLACRLSFNGDASGRLAIIASKDLVTQMAENFMGEDRDTLTQEHLTGTLAEMLNMVCGNALGMTDSRVPFELGIPERTQLSEIPAKEEVTIVETIESKMAVCLTLDGI